MYNQNKYNIYFRYVNLTDLFYPYFLRAVPWHTNLRVPYRHGSISWSIIRYCVLFLMS